MRIWSLTINVEEWLFYEWIKHNTYFLCFWLQHANFMLKFQIKNKNLLRSWATSPKCQYLTRRSILPMVPVTPLIFCSSHLCMLDYFSLQIPTHAALFICNQVRLWFIQNRGLWEPKEIYMSLQKQGQHLHLPSSLVLLLGSLFRQSLPGRTSCTFI